MRDGQGRFREVGDLAVAEKHTHPGKEEYQTLSNSNQWAWILIYFIMANS